MSARVYRFMLTFYPAELRAEFGADMTEVFLEDLEESQRRSGWVGTARVWWRSVREICRIALPGVLSRREIAVPLVMYLLQATDLMAVVFLSPRDPHSPLPRSAGELVVMVLGGSLVSAVIAHVALRVGDRSVPSPLQLRLR